MFIFFQIQRRDFTAFSSNDGASFLGEGQSLFQTDFGFRGIDSFSNGVIDRLKKLLSFFTGCSAFAMVLPSDFYSHDFLLINIIGRYVMLIPTKFLLFGLVVCGGLEKNLVIDHRDIVASYFQSWVIGPCAIA